MKEWLLRQAKELLWTGFWAAIIILFIAQSFIVDGPSMEPTLLDRQRVLAEKVTKHFVAPSRGQIVVIRSPIQKGERWIKRVIGVPGDVIEIRNGVFTLNGEVMHEDYIAQPAFRNYGPQTVPEGHIFVMGDNRNRSLDSRDAGMIPTDRVIGRALIRFWPVTGIKVLLRPSPWKDLV